MKGAKGLQIVLDGNRRIIMLGTVLDMKCSKGRNLKAELSLQIPE